MRIGLVLSGNLDMQSGGFLYDRMAVQYLRNQGDEIDLFPLPWVSYTTSLALNLSRRLSSSLEEKPVDLLVQDELAHPSLFLINRWLKKRFHIRQIAIIHHLRCCEARAASLNCIFRLIERSYLRSVDGFIFNSNETRRVVESLAGNGKPAVVAHPGGDRLPGNITREMVSSRSKAGGPLRVTFVGNITPRKGLHILISALALVGRGAWHLSIAGSSQMDGAYTRFVRQEVKRVGLEPYITFLDPITDRELARLLSESHLLAVPSFYEGFGIVYPEAMRFGLPVIASSLGGAQEVVRHGVNGFLLSPGNTATLAHYIDELAKDREKLCSMGLAALRSFSGHPTWAKTGATIHQFLHSLTG